MYRSTSDYHCDMLAWLIFSEILLHRLYCILKNVLQWNNLTRSGSRNFGERGPGNMKYKPMCLVTIFLWLFFTGQGAWPPLPPPPIRLTHFILPFEVLCNNQVLQSYVWVKRFCKYKMKCSRRVYLILILTVEVQMLTNRKKNVFKSLKGFVTKIVERPSHVCIRTMRFCINRPIESNQFSDLHVQYLRGRNIVVDSVPENKQVTDLMHGCVFSDMLDHR